MRTRILGQKDETMRYVEAAEKLGGEQSSILLDTGDALLTLGDRKAAMDRFARALDAPDANRVDARLAIARLMVKYGEDEDAKQQISLAFAESRIGEAPPVTADNLIEAANLLLAMHDFISQQTISSAPGKLAPRPTSSPSVWLTPISHRAKRKRLTSSWHDRLRSFSEPKLRLPDGARRGLSPAA